MPLDREESGDDGDDVTRADLAPGVAYIQSSPASLRFFGLATSGLREVAFMVGFDFLRGRPRGPSTSDGSVSVKAASLEPSRPPMLALVGDESVSGSGLM